MQGLEKYQSWWQQLTPKTRERLEWLWRQLSLEVWLKKIPAVKKLIQSEQDKIKKDLEQLAKPQCSAKYGFDQLPETGLAHKDILEDMRDVIAEESREWDAGQVSGAVYHGEAQHIEFLNQVYALHSQVNPLHSDIWPSSAKYESEIVAMSASMLGKGSSKDCEDICGTVTSGGTESILLAMKAYRDRAYSMGCKQPEMIIPVTAHAAFDKAADYFNIKKRIVPITDDYIADVSAIKKLMNRNTCVIVGSAPAFPHGIIDPITEIADLASAREIPVHVDACLGGFVLPFARQLGEPVPDFDFAVPGVTSISVDTHKFGFAPKGSSIVLYRNKTLRHFQYYTVTDWPGGLYFSPTLAGSRPGALSAACWAAMVSMGQSGYLHTTRDILATAKKIKAGIEKIPALKLLGDPLWVLAFTANTLDIYQIMALMAKAGWHLNGLHKPSCVHLCITKLHTKPGVAEKFLADLENSVAIATENPSEKTGMAPVYGMAASMPATGLVADILKHYLDCYYQVQTQES